MVPVLCDAVPLLSACHASPSCHIAPYQPAGFDEQMQQNLPANEFYEYFGPDYSLHINAIPGMENKNKREHLDKVRAEGGGQVRDA